jgi:AcrR family transcriptional regulator
VNQVAALAGVSIGSLYQYYPSKLALIGGVAERLAQSMTSALRAGIEPIERLPLQEAVVALVQRAFASYRLRPRLRRIIRTEVPEVVPHFDTPDFDSALAELIATHLETHRQQIHSERTRVAVIVLMLSVAAVAERAAQSSEAEYEGYMEETTAMVQRYLLRY